MGFLTTLIVFGLLLAGAGLHAYGYYRVYEYSRQNQMPLGDTYTALTLSLLVIGSVLFIIGGTVCLFAPCTCES